MIVMRVWDHEETYGSPITKESPAFTDGTRPNEPTSAAAASLESTNETLS